VPFGDTLLKETLSRFAPSVLFSCKVPFSSGGSVLRRLAPPHESKRGMLYFRKPCSLTLTPVFFCVPALQTSLQPLNEKSLPNRVRRAFLVDKVIEISNLELVKDLEKIVDFLTIM
jgi:hypothetical protein